MLILTICLSLLLGALVLFKGLKTIPHQQVAIIERFGKFQKELTSGLNWIIPFLEKVAYRHSLKEEAIDIHEQTAITQDNVSVKIDGVLYVKITDPIAASYGARNPHRAITQLVQTTMRSEIGKIPLDKTFEERDTLNQHILSAINEASSSWGIQCMRYEIKDILMPEDIRKAMELQMTAERQKRAKILESEGVRQAQINESEGKRQADINMAQANKEKVVLESEGALTDQINRAKGEAEAILAISKSTAEGIKIIAEAMKEQGSEKAVSLKVAEQYVEAFKEMAKQGNTLIVPANTSDISSNVAQALSIFHSIQPKGKQPLEGTFLKK